jgi:hypothetical protein
MNHKNLAHILQKIHVPHHREVADSFFMDDYHLAKKLSNVQAGGGDIPKYIKLSKNTTLLDTNEDIEDITFQIKYKINDSKYVFTVHQSDYSDKTVYSILNDNNKKEECVTIFYVTKEKCCYIENISSFEKCYDMGSHIGMTYTRTGTILLLCALDFIEEKLTKKHKIKYIWLKDNSNKTCKSVGGYIPLDTFYMFTHGDTWYGKYGFIPFDDNHKNTDRVREIDYKKNQKIVMTTIIGDVDTYDIFKDAVIKANEKVGKEIIPIKNVPKILDKYKSHTVMKFVVDLLEYYDKICAIFYFLYGPLMEKLGMTNLHGAPYWKKL